MTATKFGKSPFPGKVTPQPAKKKSVDLAGIEKCRDPYTPERVINKHKYDQLFEGIKEGDCFKVPGGDRERSALSRALRLYLKRHNIDGIVRQEGRTADGIGRVWLIRVFTKGQA